MSYHKNAYVCVCMRACVCVHVCVYVRTCVRLEWSLGTRFCALQMPLLLLLLLNIETICACMRACVRVCVLLCCESGARFDVVVLMV